MQVSVCIRVIRLLEQHPRRPKPKLTISTTLSAYLFPRAKNKYLSHLPNAQHHVPPHFGCRCRSRLFAISLHQNRVLGGVIYLGNGRPVKAADFQRIQGDVQARADQNSSILRVIGTAT